MKNWNCKDCKHYSYRDDKCWLGTDKEDCWDFETQDPEWEEENEEENDDGW